MPYGLRRSPLLASLLFLMPSGGMGADGASTFDKLIQSNLVHCAFYKAYEVDRINGDLVLTEGRSNSLTHFHAIRDGRAQQISTRMAGARDVRVNHGGKYLHFIDEVAGMYILTTVYDCIDRDKSSGTCLTYGAMQSRNFDPRALTDPDAVFEALRDNSDPGFCDHSFLHVREAAR